MVSLSIADLLVALSCFGGLAGVVYQAGKLAARVDSLEEWRRTMPEQFLAIREALRELEQMIRHEVT